MHDALSPMPQDSLAGLRQAMTEMVSGNAARWREFWRGDAAKRADMEQEEVEVPEWLGGLLYDAVEASNGLLIKGAGHKYIRRVPKAGGGWRYFYTVTGGQGLGHHSEMVVGAAFKIRSREGQEGHVHILEDHGDEVTLRHDESGKSARVSKATLAAMLHREHAEAVGKVRERASKTLEQAQKTGTAKQQSRAAALVEKYSGAAKPSAKPSPKTPEPASAPASPPQPFAAALPSSINAPATAQEVLAKVNALALPVAETRGGRGNWRERRHHMGDVSISATGPYAALHDASHAQLERAWRAKRLEEAGFAPHSVWGQIKNDTARSGGASETVPVGTKPAPLVPSSRMMGGVGVQDVERGPNFDQYLTQATQEHSIARERPSGGKYADLSSGVWKNGAKYIKYDDNMNDHLLEITFDGKDKTFDFYPGSLDTVSKSQSKFALKLSEAQAEEVKKMLLMGDFENNVLKRIGEMLGREKILDWVNSVDLRGSSYSHEKGSYKRDRLLDVSLPSGVIGGAQLRDKGVVQNTLAGMWRKKRLQEFGFEPKANEIHRASEPAVQPEAKPAPLVPPSQIHAGADVQGGALGQGSIFKSLVAKYARLVS